MPRRQRQFPPAARRPAAAGHLVRGEPGDADPVRAVEVQRQVLDLEAVRLAVLGELAPEARDRVDELVGDLEEELRGCVCRG